MRKFFFLLSFITLLFSACNNGTCDQDLDAINAIIRNFELAPTEQSCFQLKERINDYLEDGCSDATLSNYLTILDCSNFAAIAALCHNGIKDSLETDIDCGGFCPTCEVLPTCNDGEQNGNETGIDCGGSCPICIPEATCSDGIQNGDEEGVDCGGSCADSCNLADLCSDGLMNGDEEGIDCGGSCPNDCPAASCFDGVLNGDETGVDCGGSCVACPTCSDGIQNGIETGIDCGGNCPDVCQGGPTCSDGIQNGDETDVDCGGSCDPCITSSCTDGVQNGDETGIDCGGSCPTNCPEPAHCSDGDWNNGEDFIDCGGPCNPCADFQFECDINGQQYVGDFMNFAFGAYSFDDKSIFTRRSATTEIVALTFPEEPVLNTPYYYVGGFAPMNGLATFAYINNVGSLEEDTYYAQGVAQPFNDSSFVVVTEFNTTDDYIRGPFLVRS